MAKNTMTQISALSAILTILNSLDVSDDGIFLVGTEEIDITALTEKVEGMCNTIINRKRTPSKADTAKQNEIAGIMTCVSDVLASAGKPMTISEMQGVSADLAIYTNQKLSAVLRKMVDNGTVVRTVEKKKTYFSLV